MREARTETRARLGRIKRAANTGQRTSRIRKYKRILLDPKKYTLKHTNEHARPLVVAELRGGATASDRRGAALAILLLLLLLLQLRVRRKQIRRQRVDVCAAVLGQGHNHARLVLDQPHEGVLLVSQRARIFLRLGRVLVREKVDAQRAVAVSRLRGQTSQTMGET
jgi:hypothetical protein